MFWGLDSLKVTDFPESSSLKSIDCATIGCSCPFPLNKRGLTERSERFGCVEKRLLMKHLVYKTEHMLSYSGAGESALSVDTSPFLKFSTNYRKVVYYNGLKVGGNSSTGF